MHRLSRLVVVAGLTASSACSDLLGVELVGPVPGSSVNTPAGADGLRIGALGALHAMTATGTPNSPTNTNTPWVFTDLYTDVWQTADARNPSTLWDQRAVPNNDVELGIVWTALHTARGRAAEAIAALTKYKPTPAWGVGQMYWVMAVAEMQLAEYFCSGIPLSGSVNGAIVYAPPFSTQDVLTTAVAHLDTALTFFHGTDTAAIALDYAARVTKARVLIDLGQFAAASAAVASVPTSFAYWETFAPKSGDNVIWQVNVAARRMVVGDSVSVSTGGSTVYAITNAIPFAQLADPRLPTTGSTLGTSSAGRGHDTRTNVVMQRVWTGRGDAVPIVSGLDARLVEAEAALNAGDAARMTTILNALRASPPSLSSALTPTPLPPLSIPASSEEAVSVFFREKAVWTFGRGQRFGDLRRLVRQYGRSADRVAPSGTFFKTGTPYGRDLVLEIPLSEANNPFVKANGASYCVDKNP